MHFLSFKSRFNFKKPHGTQTYYHAHTQLHFHLPFIASTPDCLLAGMEESERVKRCFCRRPWIRKCMSTSDSTSLFNARSPSPHDSFVSTVCGHSGILSRGCWLCLVLLIWFSAALCQKHTSIHTLTHKTQAYLIFFRVDFILILFLDFILGG